MVAQRHAQLIRRQGQLLQARAAVLPIDAGSLARQQVGVKDRLDAVLQPRHLRHELAALGDAAPLQLHLLGGHPHLGQEMRRMQARKLCGIDLVGLDLRTGDGTHLQGVGDGHPVHERRQQPDDGGRVAGGLQHGFVFLRQRLGKREHRLPVHREAAMVLQQAVLQNRDLCEVTMNVQSDDSHRRSPAVTTSRRKLAGNTTTTDSRSQRNRASRRGGQLITRARSS